MQVEIHLEGWLVDETGKMNGIELGALKDTIRGHLNKEYDHHLLLNVDDPWLRSLRGGLPETPELLPPGFKGRSGDPTTENIAAWIYDELEFMLPLWKSLQVVIHETATNSVVYP
jgi:6-pyruvoyl-tetrahydropterin synthase